MKANGTTSDLQRIIAAMQKADSWAEELSGELRDAEAERTRLRGELAALLGLGGARSPRANGVSAPARKTFRSTRRKSRLPRGALQSGIPDLVARGLTVKGMARAMKTTVGSVHAELSRAAREGRLVRVSKGRYALPDAKGQST